jgi:hydrogenase maturation protease
MSGSGPAVAVIGIGNVLLSDDGFGVHAIARLRERYTVRREVELVEGGTAGLLLLPHLACTRRAILVDALDCGAAPGTVVRMDRVDQADAFSTGMTAHDVGLRDLLGAARLTGAWPEKLLLYGVQPRSTAVGVDLTPPVAAALDPVVDRVAAEISAWAGTEPLESECNSAPHTGRRQREELDRWKPHVTQQQYGRRPSAL